MIYTGLIFLKDFDTVIDVLATRNLEFHLKTLSWN